MLRRGHISHAVKMHYFFKRSGSDKPKVIVMMTKKGSTKIVNSMTLGAGVPELGCGHICHTCIVNMHYFFKIFFSTLGYVSDKLSIL